MRYWIIQLQIIALWNILWNWCYSSEGIIYASWNIICAILVHLWILMCLRMMPWFRYWHARSTDNCSWVLFWYPWIHPPKFSSGSLPHQIASSTIFKTKIKYLVWKNINIPNWILFSYPDAQEWNWGGGGVYFINFMGCYNIKIFLIKTSSTFSLATRIWGGLHFF